MIEINALTPKQPVSPKHAVIMSADPIHIFRKTWSTYQKVISNNFMFHREISIAVKQLLDTRTAPLRLLDLGCGDASHFAGILRPGQVAEYCGCDLYPYALDDARENLKPFGMPVNLLCRDMIAVLQEAPGQHFDLVYCGYALHHLPIEGKRTFFGECRRTLREGGCIVLVDVMREPGQERPDYLDSYNRTVATQWDALSPEERDQVQEHIRNCDFPETPETIRELAQHAGLTDVLRLDKHTWHEAWRFQA